MAFRQFMLIVSRHPPSATAPIAALAPFRRKISESAHQQAAEERSRKIRENRREKETKTKPLNWDCEQPPSSSQGSGE
jgi:hypothetical protein